MSTLTVENEFISQALATFDESRHAIATVQHYGTLTVAANGIGQVTEAHKFVKKLRIDIDKRRKELNEGALEYQRAVNAEAKRLTAEVEPIEGRLAAERDNYEAEKAREKEAKEAEKRAVLQGRLNRLIAAGVSVKVEDVEKMDDGFFEAFLTNESEKAESAKAEAARLEAERQAEAEAARVEAARVEAERKSEFDKQQEWLRSERKRLDAERDELRQQQEEVARQQEEAKRKLQAEREAEAAREAAARLAAAKAEKEARLAALQPDIDKAKAFGVSMTTDATDELKRIGDPWWADRAKRLIECLCGDLVNIVASGQRE